MSDVLQSLQKAGYEPLRKLGEGGFGQTFLVQNDDSLFTLKISKRSFENFLSEEARILAEIRPSCSNHLTCLKGVLRLNDSEGNPTSQVVGIISQYVPGEPLNRIPNLTLSEIDIILTDMLIALSTLHSLGIAHRDVKPANIIFDREKQEATLIDYGIAVVSPSEDFAGTIGYIWPPLVWMKPTFSSLKRNDLFALGVTIYILTNRTFPYPFDRKDDRLYDTSEYFPSEYSVKGLSRLGHISDQINDLVEDLITNPDPMSASEILRDWKSNSYLDISE